MCIYHYIQITPTTQLARKRRDGDCGMFISVTYPPDVYCDSLIVCITDYYTFPIGQQKDVCN